FIFTTHCFDIHYRFFYILVISLDMFFFFFFFFFQAEDGIRDLIVTGVQTCALPILPSASACCWVSDSPITPVSISIRMNVFAVGSAAILLATIALPRSCRMIFATRSPAAKIILKDRGKAIDDGGPVFRSEEHTSELQ